MNIRAHTLCICIWIGVDILNCLVYIFYHLYRLHFGQAEAVGLTKFQLSTGVVSKSLFNSIYVKEAAQ